MMYHVLNSSSNLGWKATVPWKLTRNYGPIQQNIIKKRAKATLFWVGLSSKYFDIKMFHINLYLGFQKCLHYLLSIFIEANCQVRLSYGFPWTNTIRSLKNNTIYLLALYAALPKRGSGQLIIETSLIIKRETNIKIACNRTNSPDNASKN